MADRWRDTPQADPNEIQSGLTDDARCDRAGRRAFFKVGQATTEVLVIGGGVIGSCLYHQLSHSNIPVILAERQDFACGSSQASAGLIWGGLMYLRHGHLGEVINWCRERERLLSQFPCLVVPQTCCYQPAPARRSLLLVRSALTLYWMLGGSRGSWPRRTPAGLEFHEARLTRPDARFTWEWIATACGSRTAFNRCAVENPTWDGKHWHLRLVDRLDGLVCELTARHIVNATGPWAETVDRHAGIDHGWRLALSRGVSLILPRPSPHSHQRTLIVEHPDHDDLLSLVPFGPASIWGSSEVLVEDPECGFRIPTEEAAELIALHRRLLGPLDSAEVIALRCGVRALAMPGRATARRSQTMGRACRILRHRERPWISLYGGKLSGCLRVAEQVVGLLGGSRIAVPPPDFTRRIPTCHFPGLDDPVPTPAHCRDHEQCWFLDDYLRRRTSIAQLVPRGGLGRNDEQLTRLKDIALVLANGDELRAAQDLAAYRHQVTITHDLPLGLTTQGIAQ